MARRRKRVTVGDETSPWVTAIKITVCILAPILGFFSAYPIMRLIDMIKGLF